MAWPLDNPQTTPDAGDFPFPARRNRALIAVDVQRDFIDGPLGGENRASVIEPLVNLAWTVDYVIASRDWHPADHCSFAAAPTYTDGSWPVHCVQGTDGADIVPEIAKLADVVVSKGTDPTREAYSAFDGQVPDGRSLHVYLSDNRVGAVVIGGLLWDYCVKATALSAKRLGYDVTVVEEAVAAVDPIIADAAIAAMRDVGIAVERAVRA